MRIYKYISMYKLGLRITAIATAETATRGFEEVMEFFFSHYLLPTLSSLMKYCLHFSAFSPYKVVYC